MSRFNPAAFFVRRWQFTLLVATLAAFLGINASVNIPRAEDPHFPLPIMIVHAVLPGATPAEMEQLVVKPIEDAVDGLDNIKKVQSTSLDNAAALTIEFTWNVDPERKYDEVVREVNGLRATLPKELTRLEVERARTSEVAVFEVALTSDTLPMRRLEKLAHRLRDRLNRLPGVREAKYWGAALSELRVSADLARLAALHLPVSGIDDALRRAGAEAPIGTVDAGSRRYDVKSAGAFRDVDALEAVPVATAGNAVVHARDVASIGWAEALPDHLTRFNGKRAVLITATQKDEADATAITREANAVMAEYETGLPPGVRLERGFFQAGNITARLDGLYRDFAIALGLVLVTLLPLGWRAGVVVMLSIPLSLMGGLAALYAMGFNLNQLAIAGAVLSLGLLVDDSIVVTENIARHLRAGAGRGQAAIAGTGQIAKAVLGCTACVIFAFLPLLALPEGSGAYIRSLPAMVLCTIAASLIVAMTVIPFAASRLLSRHENPEGNRLLRAVNGGIHRLYRPVLHAALARPRLSVGVLLSLCLLIAPMLLTIGSSLFPPADSPQFLIRIDAADGANLADTGHAVDFTETQLAATPGVIWYISNIGRGNPQIYYNLSQRDSNPAYAEIFASFKTFVPGRTAAILDDLRTRLNTYAGARISVETFENGPPVEAPIAIRITGDDLATLKKLAARTEEILRATLGTRDVGNPLRVDRTDLDLGIDQEKAATLGIGAGIARQAAQLGLTGEEVAKFRDADGDDYPVRLRLAASSGRFGSFNALDALQDIYLPAAAGQSVSLRAIASPSLHSSTARIDRYNRARSVTVTAYVQTGALTSAVTADAVARLRQGLVLPGGYGLALGGQAEAQSTGFAGLAAAIGVAVFGTMAVLVLEFGSFRTALVVAGVIPLGLLGAVSALMLSGNALSFTATIGIISLIGIEIKNSILLVDFTEQLRAEGIALRPAIETAGEVRFLPVLLTSITAIGGLLPLAVEHSGLYSPLAIAVIGGLVSSTLLSRIATPAMYLLLADSAVEGPGRAAD